MNTGNYSLNRFTLGKVVVLMALFFAFGMESKAATRTWNVLAGGSFITAANWTPSTPVCNVTALCTGDILTISNSPAMTGKTLNQLGAPSFNNTYASLTYTNTASNTITGVANAWPVTFTTISMSGTGAGTLTFGSNLNNIFIGDGTTQASSVNASKTLAITSSRAFYINTGTTLTINGTMTVSDTLIVKGNIIVDGSSASLTLGSSSELFIQGGSITVRNGGTVTISGGTAHNLSSGSINVGGLGTSNGTFNLNGSSVLTFSGGTINIGATSTGAGAAQIVYGTPTFLIASSAQLNQTGSGCNLNVLRKGVFDIQGRYNRTGGNFTPNTTALNANTVIYRYSSASNNIQGVPYYNLTLNSFQGGALAGNASVVDSLTLTSGRLVLGTYNLTLSPTGVALTSLPFTSSKMVVPTSTGEFRKELLSVSTFTFPVGDATGPYYTPITVAFASGSFPASSYVGISLRDVKQPNVTVSNYLERYWKVSSSGITGFSATVSATYNSSDVFGTETALVAARYIGTSLTEYTAVDDVNNILSVSGLTAFGDFTAVSPGCSPLAAGTYTIGGSSPDYADFGSAVTDLISCGIAGPVVFDVRTGSYTDQISIPGISGSSSTNTITFKSVTGTRSDVTLTNSTAVPLTFTAGAQFITFRDMTISNTNATTSAMYVVDMQGAINDITLDNCVLAKTAYASGNGTNYGVVNANQTTTTLMSNLKVNNCDIQNGGCGIYFNSSTSGSYRWTGVEITNNTFSGQVTYGAVLNYLSALIINDNVFQTGTGTNVTSSIDVGNCTGSHEITGNSITMNASATSFVGIEMATSAGSHNISENTFVMSGSGTMSHAIHILNSAGAHLISKNRVYSTSGNITYGIFMGNTSGGSSGSPAIISNNRIQTTGATGITANGGIYLSTMTYTSVYYNSVNVTATSNAANSSTSAGAFYVTNGSNLIVRNNIFQQLGSAGFAFNYASAGATSLVSNNDYYAPNSANYGRVSSTLYPTGATWSESGFQTANPIFASATDLRITQGSLDGAAVVISGISDDFDGDTRNLTIPDIGSDEFTGSAIVAAFSASSTSICAGSTVTFTDLSTNVPTTWAWAVTPIGAGFYTFVGGTTSASQNPQIQFTGSGAFTISLTASNLTSNDVETKTSYIGLALNGTYTIGGTTPDYATFGDAVTDLNTIGVCGPVIMSVRNGTYTETITINSIPGASATNTVTFQPETGAAVTLTSAVIGANAATLTFDGADYVILEGRINGGSTPYSFTITNSGVTASAIQYLNDATNNTIQYCNVQGGFNQVNGGLIEFGTSASGSTGNSNILIDHNRIGNPSSLTVGGIYSQGTSGVLNSDNTITNNEIFNFGDGGGNTGYGIRVTSTGNGGNWNISDNSFYHSTGSSSSAQFGINFLPGTNSSGNTIMRNYVGGSAALCAGSAWSASNSVFTISVNVGTATATLIRDNVIQNISSSGEIDGIYVTAGATNIIANTIGHATTANSLITNGSAISIFAIYASTNSPTFVDSNTIANLTANSGSNSVYGITVFGTGGRAIVTNNTLSNIVGNGTGGSQLVRGIYVSIGSVSNNVVDSNDVSYFGNNSNVNVITDVSAIWVAGTSSGGTVRKNKISNIYQRQPGTMSGIYLTGSGSYEVSNNIVETDNNGYVKATFIYGIRNLISSGSVNAYYNTILIAGATPDNSFGYLRGSTSTATLNNNILINAGTSGTGSHYAIYNANATGLTSNYNLLATAFPANLGYWVSGAVTFAGWQGNGVDANSTNATTTTGSSSSTLVNPAELFTDYTNGDLTIGTNASAQAFISNNGTPVTVLDDITGLVRSVTTPDKGAYEFTPCTPPTAGITNNTGSTVVTCTTTAISVTATGGNTYAWSGGATPATAANSLTSAATYTVTVTSLAGCTASASITITVDNTAPTVAITNNTGTTVITCTTTAISVTAGGANTYAWSGGATPTTAANSLTSAATYTVTGTNITNGCTASDNITITTNNASPTVGITNNTGSTVLTCNTTAISVTATGASSYAWSGGATPATANNSLTTAAIYTVTGTDAANGCTDVATITVTANNTTPSVTPGTNPTVCTGATSANLTYTGATGSPNEYSIAWGGTAISAGFTNVTNATLSSSPIVITVPGAAAANTYTGTLTVRNTTTGCVSGNNSISVITQACGAGTSTWVGGPGGNWDTASNWSPVGVPNGCATNVFIGINASPIINVGDVSVGNINLASGATITLQGRNLNVCGKWTGSNNASNAAVVGSGTTFINSTDSAQIITGFTKFDILQINNTFGVSLETGAKVSIAGGLHLQAGVLTVSAGTLRILSTSATNNGYIDDFTLSPVAYTGSISGNIVADRYIPVVGRNQHFISSPVSTPALSQLGASGPDGSFITPTPDCDETRSAAGTSYGNVFTYVDGHMPQGGCMLGNWMVTSVGSMQNGKGYSTYLTGNSILSLTGAANTGAIAISGLNNSGYDSVQTKQGQWIESGWNLVGNPYPSAIDMTVSRIADGFQSQVQIWVTSGPFAGSWQADVIDGSTGHLQVAPFQAFMVRAVHGSLGNHSYSFHQSERTRLNNVQFYRTQSANTLKLELDYNGVKDITKVAFNPSATIAFDDEYDANKYNGGAGRPTLYTTTASSGSWYAINTLPLLTNVTTVPVGLRPEANGTMSISASQIESFDPTTYILLEDKLTGQLHNLRDGAYTFTTTKTDNQNRFVLHFTPAAQILTTDASCEANGMITVEQQGNANWNYTITDINSTVIASGVLNELAPVAVSATPGMYNLSLADNKGYTVVKAIQVGGTPAIAAAFNTSVATTEVQENVDFAGTVDAVSYNWSFGDGTTGSGKTVSHNYQSEGVYNVTLMVTSASGCTSATTRSVTVTSRSITGIDEVAAKKITIWSHDNRVYVDFSKQGKVEAQIDMYNVLGQLITSEKFGRSTIYTREISNMEAGYLIIRVNNDSQVITKKVFIANK